MDVSKELIYHYEAIELLYKIDLLDEKIQINLESIAGVGGNYLSCKTLWEREILSYNIEKGQLIKEYDNLKR